MRWVGGHLGAAVSALVDGQLDAEASERAWEHVVQCKSCRSAVERETWVKDRLSRAGGGEPSSRLMRSLEDLVEQGSHPASAAESRFEASDARGWPDIGLPPHAGGRRRAGIALVGAGSVSAAVLGLVTLGAPPLNVGGVGGAPASVSDATQPPRSARVERSSSSPEGRPRGGVPNRDRPTLPHGVEMLTVLDGQVRR